VFLYYSLKPHPAILISHFFAVALYAMYHTFKSSRLWTVHKVVYKAIMIFIRACSIIFPLMWSEIVPVL